MSNICLATTMLPSAKERLDLPNICLLPLVSYPFVCVCVCVCVHVCKHPCVDEWVGGEEGGQCVFGSWVCPLGHSGKGWIVCVCVCVCLCVCALCVCVHACVHVCGVCVCVGHRGRGLGGLELLVGNNIVRFSFLCGTASHTVHVHYFSQYWGHSRENWTKEGIAFLMK